MAYEVAYFKAHLSQALDGVWVFGWELAFLPPNSLSGSIFPVPALPCLLPPEAASPAERVPVSKD